MQAPSPLELRADSIDQHPFDGVASGYDARFTDMELGRWLRAAVWDRLAVAFQPGEAVIDLGCGTGEDALWLARRGVRVTAVDASASMLAVATDKARRAGVNDRISFSQVDLASLSATAFLSPDGSGANDQVRRFDGALSNFGPLNCLPDRRPLAAALASAIRPGGTLVLVVMGPLCPWEIGWYLAHGRPRTATRRFRRGGIAQVGAGSVRVWYPSPRRLRAEFSRDFIHVRTEGLGVALPPSELGHLVKRAPRLFQTLRRVEAPLSRRAPGTWLNDHYISLFTRR